MLIRYLDDLWWCDNLEPEHHPLFKFPLFPGPKGQNSFSKSLHITWSMHLRSTQGNLRNDRNSRYRQTNTTGWGSQLSGNIDWNKCISCYSLATGAISDDKISWDQYTPCSLRSVLGNTTLGTVFLDTLDTLDTKKHCKNCKTALFKVWIVENVFWRQMIYIKH